MRTILFVKTSSLGDVVHNCPAVSDAARAAPGAAIDWFVEEPFAGIAAMHRAVRRVIPVAVRRWRSALWKPAVWSELGAWRRRLRAASNKLPCEHQYHNQPKPSCHRGLLAERKNPERQVFRAYMHSESESQAGIPGRLLEVGEENPFIVGADGVQRYFTVMAECALASKIRVGAK